MRRPKHEPATATMAPCATSPNMKPNISGARIATSKLGSASPAAGTPIMPVTVSNGRAQRGLRSTDGATAPAGACGEPQQVVQSLRVQRRAQPRIVRAPSTSP